MADNRYPQLQKFEAQAKRVAAVASKNTDIILIAALMGIIGAILIPMPPLVMDFLLIMNITLSVMTLVTVIYVTEPLQFSVFPTLLLIATLFRLALNVGTTRMILSNAGELGDLAAGHVVRAFGTFVAGNNLVVGIVVFAIIVVIQFVVITKGATRIAEVAARFTLDAMPGKQMAIDADLNAGLISEPEARARRSKISREADFYGAMDGASKFVRGDAVAGIIITIINIVGGLVIGTLMHGMDLANAARVFTTLTIGDGLVSQVPGLITSVAAGLIVTRAGQEAELGGEFMGQIFGTPKAMYVAAALLLVLLITPLPAFPLTTIAMSLAGMGWIMGKNTQDKKAEAEKSKAKEEVKKPEKVDALLHVDPLEMEVGYGLIRLVDATQGGDLLDRITMIRRQLAIDLGLVVPPIRIRDNMQLKPNDYAIKIRGTAVARGSVESDQFLAMDAGLAAERIEGIPTTEPAFGFPAVWIPESRKERAEALGYTVVSASSVLATHLTEVLRNHADQILTREDVTGLIKTLGETSPSLVKEVFPEVLKPGELQKVLQLLLRERVSIRDLGTIVETLADYAPRTKDPEILTEYARAALARTICDAVKGDDAKVRVVTLDPKVEELIRGATEQTEQGSFLTLSPGNAARLQNAMIQGLEPLTRAGNLPVVLCSPQVRRQVRRLMERSAVPNTSVVSYNEILRDVEVESFGVVALE